MKFISLLFISFISNSLAYKNNSIYSAFSSYPKNFCKAIDLIEKNDIKNLKRLISKHSKLKTGSNDKNKTLLHIAIIKNRRKIVKLLLTESFINIYKADDLGLTPIDYEIFNLATNNKPIKARSYILKNLIHEGAKLNRVNKYGVAPIHLAVIHNNIKLVKLLIKYGANINFIDKDGWTALHWAVLLNLGDMIKFLVKNHANVKIKNFNGLIPYDLVKYSNDCDRCFKYFTILRLKSV